MKQVKRNPQKKLSCSINCPCGTSANVDLKVQNLPKPNSLAESSFNQERMGEYVATCSGCNRTYTIEIYVDNENLWAQVWNNETAQLMPDESINIIH